MNKIENIVSKANFAAILPTNEAAQALNRAPQTLRKWARLKNGPIQPVRINGRFAWKVEDIKKILSGE